MVRKTRYLVTLLFIFTALTGCASSPNVFFDSDPEQDFSQYQTFAWVSDNPMQVQGDHIVNPLIGVKVKESIQLELESKGYRYVANDSQADLLISFTLGARDKVRTFENSQYVVNEWRWGRQYWGPTMTTSTTIQYVKGTLAIDLFDNSRSAPVWHGRASKRLSSEEQIGSTENIAPAVSAILTSFPAR